MRIISISLIALVLILTQFCIHCQDSTNIQAGVSQLSMNGITLGNFTITYKNAMASANYNSLVNVGFVDNYKPSNGINLIPSCSSNDKTQANIKCTITAVNGNNVNNIVYVTYIASSYGSLLVGSFQQSITFSGATSKSTTISQNVPVNSSFFNSSNAALIQSMIFVSGISSFDDDFSLKVSAVNYNVASSKLQFSVNLLQVHATSITITFGFLMYDPRAIVINLFTDLSLIPGNVAVGMLYGIYQINRGLAGQQTRLLQAMNLNKNKEKKVDNKNAQTIPKINYKGKKNQNKQKFDASKIAKKVRDQSFNPREFKIISKCFDPVLYNEYSEVDGILDSTNPSYRKVLASNKCLPAPPIGLEKTSISNLPRNLLQNSTQSIGISVQSNVAEANSVPVSPSQSQFNTLFSTNGFVILTTADDVDPIYYFQVSPVQQLSGGIASRSASSMIQPSADQSTMATTSLSINQEVNSTETITNTATQEPIYVQSIIENTKQKSINCENGNLISRISKVNFIQRTTKIICLQCKSNEVFDLNTRRCV